MKTAFCVNSVERKIAQIGTKTRLRTGTIYSEQGNLSCSTREVGVHGLTFHRRYRIRHLSCKRRDHLQSRLRSAVAIGAAGTNDRVGRDDRSSSRAISRFRERGRLGVDGA
jgi:hypothetical protein